MKVAVKNGKSEEQQDLERFIEASEQLVRRAKKDKKFALQFLRNIGYFEMMPDAANGEHPTSASSARAPKASASRGSVIKGASVKTAPAKRKAPNGKQ